MNNHGSGLFRNRRRCTRQNQPHVVDPSNLIQFFTNGVFGGAKRGCGNAGKTLGEHIKQAAKDVKKVAKNIEKEIKKADKKCKDKKEKKRGRGLCHIRTRATPVEVTETKPAEEPKVERHPRFEEFKKVFTNTCPDQVDKFLRDNNGVTDDNELYNKAIAKFLN